MGPAAAAAVGEQAALPGDSLCGALAPGPMAGRRVGILPKPVFSPPPRSPEVPLEVQWAMNCTPQPWEGALACAHPSLRCGGSGGGRCLPQAVDLPAHHTQTSYKVNHFPAVGAVSLSTQRSLESLNRLVSGHCRGVTDLEGSAAAKGAEGQAGLQGCGLSPWSRGEVGQPECWVIREVQSRLSRVQVC